MSEPLKIGVLLSGSGTNLQAIIDRIADGSLNASIELVVSSRPSAYGLKRAEAAGLQTLTLSKEMYADPEQADEDHRRRAQEPWVRICHHGRLHAHGPRRRCLAAYPNRVVNLHPALRRASAAPTHRRRLRARRQGHGRHGSLCQRGV